MIPILIFTHDRVEYLRKTLETLFKYMPHSGFTVFISQDGFFESVSNLIKTYGDSVIHLKHDRKFIVPEDKKRFAVYHAISQHYKWGLTKVFNHPNQFSRVIILEEDIEVSPDFFNYFSALSPLLDKDENLLCISSWNDNGQSSHVKDESNSESF
jgi:alpha-1,3-mannosyl-glycoprotein beta-1,2-N-acetylglucosaminyltransferase